MKRKKVFIQCYNGCILSKLDTALFKDFFKENKWLVTRRPDFADVILVNTCGSIKEQEDAFIERVQYLNKLNKRGQLIVCGCLPKINKERVKKVFNGLSFGPTENAEINRLITAKRKLNEETSGFVLKWFGEKVFAIKICTGCNNRCSYCAVRFAKGKLKSRSIEQIIRDVEKGVKEKAEIFLLVGDEIGQYGRDKGLNLSFLLQYLLGYFPDLKFHLRNLHPESLIKMVSETSGVSFWRNISLIHTPLQSGNDRILQLMHRNYTVEGYKLAIEKWRMLNPFLRIHLDVIVGFPSETDKEFSDTLRVVKEIVPDFVFVAKFSSRPGIEAIKLPHQIPDSIKIDRIKKFKREIRIPYRLAKKHA